MADYDYKCVPFLLGAPGVGGALTLGEDSDRVRRGLEKDINTNAVGGWEFYGLYQFEAYAMLIFRKPK